MDNNFIVLEGYKMLGYIYCAWKEDLEKTKHIN